ncbi:MAG: hypothetical protein DME99_13145 [Verrucomicrobia bacterium]|nr:MAG: hypothetical protein DME99_13145 [Verrucomicrobiota bacterium]
MTRDSFAQAVRHFQIHSSDFGNLRTSGLLKFQQIFHIRNDALGRLAACAGHSSVNLASFCANAAVKRRTHNFRDDDSTCHPSTLHRLENGDQSITLRGLQQIMKRLKCTLSDVFEA